MLKRVIIILLFLNILLASFIFGYSIARKSYEAGEDSNKPGGSTASPSGDQPAEDTIQEPKDPIKEQIKGMTLEEKIGQMVVVGLEGYNVDEKARKMIEDYKIGGFVLFGRNIKDSGQLLELTNSLKEVNRKNKIPLFISVDEEGGRVTRMPEELKKLPAAGVIGKTGDESYSFEVGRTIAGEIKALGFNMNFAPVLDINSNPKNPVIGDRAFGSEPEVVTRLGVQAMKGIQSEDIIPVVKHFPGHGDTSTDSHVGLPRVDNGLDRLKSFELLPFKKAIENGADAVMVAHILLPEIDPDYPSSLSEIVINDILREDCGFDGVVFTDDITMGAITENYDIGDAAVKSVSAGADIVLVCHGYDREEAVINVLKSAVSKGDIPEERLDESLYRILKLKEKYGLADDRIDSVNIEEINSRIDAVLR
jgi:beta-N-acetylhexosaminidase